MDKKLTFGQKLAALRKEKGYTSQKAFAEALGLAPATINYYENDQRKPDFETFGRIADLLNVPYDYLLGKSESKQREHIDIQEVLHLTDDAIHAIDKINRLSLKDFAILESRKNKGKFWTVRFLYLKPIQVLNMLLESGLIPLIIYNFIDLLNAKADTEANLHLAEERFESDTECTDSSYLMEKDFYVNQYEFSKWKSFRKINIPFEEQVDDFFYKHEREIINTETLNIDPFYFLTEEEKNSLDLETDYDANGEGAINGDDHEKK